MKRNPTYIAWRFLSFSLALAFPLCSIGSEPAEKIEPVDFTVIGRKIEIAQRAADYYNIGRLIGQLQYLANLARKLNSNLQESNVNFPTEGDTRPNEKVSCDAVDLEKAHCDQVAYSAYAEWIKTCRSYTVINTDAQCRAEKKANLDTDLKSCIFIHRYNSVNCNE